VADICQTEIGEKIFGMSNVITATDIASRQSTIATKLACKLFIGG
jgi:hypothetical protein